MGNNDYLVWPDGTWCMAEDMEGYHFMSDDFRVIKFGTQEWMDFYKEVEGDAE